jgi:hypothetical protein
MRKYALTYHRGISRSVLHRHLLGFWAYYLVEYQDHSRYNRYLMVHVSSSKSYPNMYYVLLLAPK